MYMALEIEGALVLLGLNFGKTGNLFINEVELYSFDENNDIVRELTKEDMKKITKKMEEYKNKNTNQNPDQLLVDYIKELRDELC